MAGLVPDSHLSPAPCVRLALLSVRIGGDPGGFAAPLIGFGPEPLLAYQIRQAVALGATRIVIDADAASPELARLVSEASAAGAVVISVLNDRDRLGDLLGEEGDLLVIGEHMVLPQEAITALGQTERGAALLVLPVVPATRHFERIDATHVWAGAALLPGDLVRAMLDPDGDALDGDWDLALTLVRRAVQADAVRIELAVHVAMDGRLAQVVDQRSADLALSALGQAALADAVDDGPLSHLMAPLRRRLVDSIVRRQMAPLRLHWVGTGLLVAGLGLALLDWRVAALALGLVGLAAVDLGRQSAALFRMPDLPDWQRVLPATCGLAMLGLIGLHLAEWHALALMGVLLPLALMALLHSLPTQARTPDVDGFPGWLRLTIASAMLLVLVGQMLGLGAEAFVLLGLAACGETALLFRASARGRV